MIQSFSTGVTNPRVTSQRRQSERTCSIGELFSSLFSTQKVNIDYSYSHKFSVENCGSFRVESSSLMNSISESVAIWNPINRKFVQVPTEKYAVIRCAVVAKNGHVLCDVGSLSGGGSSTKIWCPKENVWIVKPELNKQHQIFPTFTAEGYVLTYSQPRYHDDLDLNPSANEEEVDAKKMEELSQKSTLKIWDPTSWTCVHTLNLPDRYIQSLAVTKEGHIITMSTKHSKCNIEIWNLETKECLAAFSEDLVDPISVFMTPEDLLVLRASFNEIQIWDPRKQTCVHKICVEEDSSKLVAIENALITQEGTLLVVYSEPGGPQKMKIFDPKTGEQLCNDFVPKADGQLFITPDGYFVLKEHRGGYKVRYFNRDIH